MWQKVAKFKGAEYFRKALYLLMINHSWQLTFSSEENGTRMDLEITQ